MKKFLVAAVIALSATACMKQPEEAHSAGNDITVETLFTHDGCTVYRFYDNNWRYFTNCKGRTEWNESCGKNCSKQQSVDGQP